MKTLSDSYLYQTVDYNKMIFQYLVGSPRVEKNTEGFFDIEYAVKKQAPAIISKVLKSDKVVLTISQKGISRLFKVIYAKDPKDGSNTKKVFIDCAGIMDFNNGVYTCKKIGHLISYLTTAMIYIIYYNRPKAILNNATITKTGSEAFVDLMIYILEKLKVPVTLLDNKEKMSFVIAEYYQTSVLGLENSQTVRNVAQKVAGIKDNKLCDYLHTLFMKVFTEDCDIQKFMLKFAEVFLDQKEELGETIHDNRIKLTIDALAQQWMYSYGPSTVLGIECFVPFSQILTDCYNGSYLNQQNTIEKIANGKTITSFSNELIKVGGENG